MKTKDGQWVKRKGQWIRLPDWLRDWREGKTTQTLRKGAKVDPRANVKV